MKDRLTALALVLILASFVYAIFDTLPVTTEAKADITRPCAVWIRHVSFLAGATNSNYELEFCILAYFCKGLQKVITCCLVPETLRKNQGFNSSGLRPSEKPTNVNF